MKGGFAPESLGVVGVFPQVVHHDVTIGTGAVFGNVGDAVVGFEDGEDFLVRVEWGSFGVS